MYDFNNFIEELEQFVSSADSYRALIDAGSASMQKLITNQGLLDDSYLSGLLDGSAESTIYKSENNNFIVQVFVWEAGSKTPIHDHDTWGLMGIYRNQLKICEYTLKPLGQPDNFTLEPTQVFTAVSGSVCYLIPPDEEIHQITNTSEDLSVSIHVYGKTIDEYNIYDLENDKIIHRIVS